MKIALVTLCLNEAEFLERNYLQHRNWPGLCSWVFVEAADRAYAEASPHMVSGCGKSVDGTSEILSSLSSSDDRVIFRQYGFLDHDDVAQAKIIGRNVYMSYLEKVRPDVFIHVDADEFYTTEDQLRINCLIESDREFHRCYRLRQRHIWRPPSAIEEDRFKREVIGGYWDVEHVRVFRWASGLRYVKTHNWPEMPDYLPTKRMLKLPSTGPQCIHLGFARNAAERLATNRYYQHRGEGRETRGTNRQHYVDCRSAWSEWRIGKALPHDARVIDYRGPIPEVYQ